jgi:hypothetical protein
MVEVAETPFPGKKGPSRIGSATGKCGRYVVAFLRQQFTQRIGCNASRDKARSRERNSASVNSTEVQSGHFLEKPSNLGSPAGQRKRSELIHYPIPNLCFARRRSSRAKQWMAEGEELKTNNELTIRPIRGFCDQLQLALGGQGCKLPDYARYDDARIGFAGME